MHPPAALYRPGRTPSLVLLLLLLSLVAGCVGRFSERRLPVAVPENYRAGALSAPFGNVDGWAAAFGDPVLSELIGEALEKNLDLRLAAARVTASRLAAEDAGAEGLPTLGARLRSERARTVSEEGGSAFAATGASHGISFDLSWEADLWGRISDLSRAFAADLGATEADLGAARLFIAGETARSWFSLTAATLQAQLARSVEESYARSLSILERRYRTGLNPALDLNLIKSSGAEARSRRLAAEQAAEGQSRSLEILLARYPEGRLKGAKHFAMDLAPLPGGLPSGLLERRPDIRASRLRVLAADLRTGAAEKARLPRLLLTAGGGTVSDALKELIRSDRLVWNLAGELTQPLFDAGRRERAVKEAENTAEQAWLQYAGVVLSAFREVETALDADGRLAARQENLRAALAASEAADRQAWRQYLAGDTEIITVLDSRRRVLDARTGLVAVGAARLRNRVNLYLALGGTPSAWRESADRTSKETS